MTMPDDNSVVAQKLDVLIRLVSMALTDGKRQVEQIRILSLAGVKPVEIAEMLGTTPNTVNVALSGLRREGSLHSGGKKRNAKT